MALFGYAPLAKIKKNREEEAARLADPLAGLEERKAAFAKLQGGPVVSFAKEAFVRTPVRLGVTGAAAVEDAYRLFRKKYDAATPERVTEGYNVPGFGQVKPFGAAKGATKETLKMPTFVQQSLEGGGAAFDIASTLAMAAPGKVTLAGVRGLAKLAKPLGAVERSAAKLANVGQRVLPKAGTLGRGFLRMGVQGTADASIGAAESVAADLARGDVSAEDMKKNAATSALISALLPVTIAGVSGTTRGVARQVGQKETHGTAARNIIRTVGEEAGLLDVSEASLARKGNLGRQFKTKMFERETELKDALDKLKSEAKTPKYETVAGLSGKVEVDPALTKKIAATEAQLRRTQQFRDLSTKWLDDRAPVMNNIAVLRQKGMDAQGEQDLMNLTEQSRVTDTVVTGDLIQRFERMEDLRPSDIPQDWWRKRVDEYADLKTKLETTRNDIAGQAQNQARLNEIENEFLARGDDSLDRLRQTHQDVITTKNIDELDKNVAAGLVSPEEAARLKTENPNYSRLVAIEHLDDEGTARLFGSTRDAKGKEWKARSEEARANFETMGATEANALAAYASAARRTKNVQLTDLVDKNVTHGTGVFDLAEKAGPDTVTIKRNGVEEHYKVNDRQMLDYIKGKEKTEATGVLKVINAMADWTRKFATGVNPVFGVSNMIRDYNSAVTNVGNKIPMGVDDVAGNLIPAYDYLGHAAGKTDPKILEVLRIGGPLTFISKEVKGGEVPEIVALFSSKKPRPTVLSSVSRMNEASELATRLGVYDAAKRAGITDENELRALMRDATVDFTKSGSTMREVNKSIPFINARLQGLRNTIKAIASDPAGQARKAQIYAMFPQLVIDSMNERYGSLADKISASDRQDFYTPIVGKHTDEEGNEQPTYIRIPKGTMQSIAGLLKDLVEKDSPLTDKEKAEDFAIGLIKMSPIDQMPQVGGFLATYKALKLNKDDRGYTVFPEYLNKPEVPARQKKRASTSKSIEGVTDFLSRMTGGTDTKEGLIELSPAQVEFAIQSGIPGVGGQIVDTMDMFRNLAKTGTVQPENRTSDTVGSDLAQLPFSSYFVKDRALSAPKYVTDRNIEAARQMNVVKGGEKEVAMSKLDAIKKAPTQEERAQIAAGLSQQEKDLIVKEMKKKSYVYGVEPGSPPMERAVQIFNAVKAASEEEMPNIAKQLKENNVVSKDTAKYLAAYSAYMKVKELDTPEERAEVLNKLSPESKEALVEYVNKLKQ